MCGRFTCHRLRGVGEEDALGEAADGGEELLAGDGRGIVSELLLTPVPEYGPRRAVGHQLLRVVPAEPDAVLQILARDGFRVQRSVAADGPLPNR